VAILAEYDMGEGRRVLVVESFAEAKAASRAWFPAFRGDFSTAGRALGAVRRDVKKNGAGWPATTRWYIYPEASGRYSVLVA
jgi:hypothetical protein